MKWMKEAKKSQNKKEKQQGRTKKQNDTINYYITMESNTIRSQPNTQYTISIYNQEMIAKQKTQKWQKQKTYQ